MNAISWHWNNQIADFGALESTPLGQGLCVQTTVFDLRSFDLRRAQDRCR
jgi:hypothetical protein